MIVTRNSLVAYGRRFRDASERGSTFFPIDTRRQTVWRSTSTTLYSNYCAVYDSTLDGIGQPCYLGLSLLKTLLVHSGLSTHPSNRILASLVRSLYTCCSTCDLQSQFRKTQVTCYNNYTSYTLSLVRSVLQLHKDEVHIHAQTVDIPSLRSRKQGDSCYI
jgi:hypothetical protein